jgi:hypothetical protein
MTERKIYWLASYPKSGNTWVRLFLDTYVTNFAVNFNSAYRYVNLDHDLGMLQLVSAKPVNTLTLNEQLMYQPAMLANLLHQAKTKDVVVKTHNANITIGGIPLVPKPLTGGVIYIVRDPRDVCISYASHLNMSIDDTIKVMGKMEHMAHSKLNKLLHVMSSWSTHVQSWMAISPKLIIKYENLLEYPKEGFRKILEFLGITEIDEQIFNFAFEQTTFQNLQEMEEKQGFIERSDVSKDNFFRVGKSEQWRDRLLAHQVDAIVKDHGEIMNSIKYLT